MSRPPDILSDMLTRIRVSICVCVKSDTCALEKDLGLIECEMRREYGGDCHRVYCRAPELTEKIAQDLIQGDSVGKISKRYGVSRATVYRARMK